LVHLRAAVTSTTHNYRGDVVGFMTYRTTIGWSLITSGIVTLLLAYLPGQSWMWGVGLLVLGIVIFAVRR